MKKLSPHQQNLPLSEKASPTSTNFSRFSLKYISEKKLSPHQQILPLSWKKLLLHQQIFPRFSLKYISHHHIPPLFPIFPMLKSFPLFLCEISHIEKSFLLHRTEFAYITPLNLSLASYQATASFFG